MKLTRIVMTYLYHIGFVRALPGSVIRSMPAVDCGEPLVAIIENNKLFLRPFSPQCEMVARKTVVEKIYRATSILPDEYSLLICDAYRSTAYQQERWNQRIAEVKAAFPNATLKEIETKAARFTARPTGVGSGHQAGAAVDVTLGNRFGEPLDLGTAVKAMNELSPTEAHGLNAVQRNNRRILLDAMCESGFINYPLEWWHYCYGDRMWAAYSAQELAIYDRIETSTVE